MINSITAQALTIILNDKSLEALRSQGLTYSQISNVFKELEEAGYIEQDENGYYLTTLGKDILKDTRATKGGDWWISKNPNFQREPWGEYDIFLPSGKEFDGQ